MTFLRPTTPRVRVALAGLAGAALLAGCSATGAMSSDSAQPGARAVMSNAEWMPAAPRDRAAWLREVDRIYAHAGGRGQSAEAWLRQRMAHRRPGERLAVVLGIDDVMLQTHFGGIGTLVPPSVQLVRAAHALGYAVFYVTGRSAGSGLGQVEATIERAGVPANAFYGRPIGAVDEEAAKAECRAAIKRQGYTLALVVAASEASFDGSPLPEKEIRLPDFSLPG